MKFPRRLGSCRLIFLAFIVLLLLAGMGGFAWWRSTQWRWQRIPMPEKIAQVPKEWTVDELAKRLQEKGKLRDAAAFREAAAEIKLKRIAPGGYLLPREAGPRDLAKVFSRPPGLVKITFPEGFTAGQVAARLAARGFKNAGALPEIVYPAGEISRHEGRLFPDTYYLPPQGTAPQLLAPLHARFKEVLADLPTPFPVGAGGKPLTKAELLTLASLVEREAADRQEMPLIAGVLLNRLHAGMRLQCDATVQYARRRADEIGGHKERLKWRDLEIDSPYNTYRHAGLPPGPICNPGRDALRAAARPEKTAYLFYVMSPQLRRHRFSVNFAGHQRNIALARAER